MRIIFFGSDCFGIPALEKLKKQHTIAAIVTAPDRPGGRGLKLSCTPVKDWALMNNIPVYQPEWLSDRDFTNALKKLNPELIVLISYGKILPMQVLKIPSIAAINVHPSLLPAYRGAAPMEWALINGDEKTGITVMVMHGRMDTGDIMLQKEVAIGKTEDIFSLKKRLSEISPEMLSESIDKLRQGFTPSPQKGIPSFARKLKKEDGLIRWEKTATQIYNLIRGTKEWPGAYTYLNSRYLKIFDAGTRKEDSLHGKPGEVVSVDKNSIVVACGEGILQITEVQMEGKKRMPVSEFLKGNRIKNGDRFSKTKDERK